MQKENKKIQSYVFYPIDSCMYIWQEEDSVVIIDPCVSKDALLYLRERNINRILVILTHEHYAQVRWIIPIEIYLNFGKCFLLEKKRKYKSIYGIWIFSRTLARQTKHLKENMSLSGRDIRYF